MKKILDALLKAYASAKTRRELYALSDHMLRDIGLRREQIPLVRVSSDDRAARAPRAATAHQD